MPADKKLKKTKKINLVPKEGLSSTTSGKILIWLLSTFRVLLIVTEIFVIGAFISRFWLDAKNTDLTEEMKEAKAVIASFSTFESDFKDIQKRLDIFNSYKDNIGKINNNIEIITSYKPDGVYFNSLDANTESVTVLTTSVNEIALQQYLVNLKSSDKLENVKMQNIGLEKDGVSINCTITADIKREI